MRTDVEQNRLVVTNFATSAITKGDVTDIDRQRTLGQRHRLQRLRRPDRKVEHRKQPSHTGHCRLCLVEHLGELGDGFKEPVCEEHEPNQRTGREATGGTASNTNANDS